MFQPQGEEDQKETDSCDFKDTAEKKSLKFSFALQSENLEEGNTSPDTEEVEAKNKEKEDD